MSTFDRSLRDVDIAALLAPISPAHPAGTDLQRLSHSVYVEVENLLEGASVPSVLAVDEGGRQTSSRDLNALGRSVAEGLKRALGCLSKESKDLDILALGARGLLAVHGYEGLWCSLYLLRELHERFWEPLYPNPPAHVQTHDEFDEPLPEPLPEPALLSERRVLVARSSAVERTEYTLRGMLRMVPLFVTEDGTLCRIADWESAKSPEAERSVEELNALAGAQPAEVLGEVDALLEHCIEECKQLDAVLQRLYARTASTELALRPVAAPQLSALLKELQDCRRFVSHLRDLSEKKDTPGRQLKGASTRIEGRTKTAPSPGIAIPSGRYQPCDRAEAIGMLLSAGQFLQRHEPLSPLPHLLFRLVHWARGGSLRPWLEDMFRTSDDERELVLLRLALDEETKLAAERLPANCPVPRDRADALVMLNDVSAKLSDYEPLSPLPYHLGQLLALASEGSPRPWLAQVFERESATLSRIYQALGLAAQPTTDESAQS